MVMWLGNNKSVIKSCKLWTLGNWKLEMTNFTTTLFCVSKTIISRRRRYQPLYSPKNLCNLKEELIIIEREIVRLRKLRKTEEEKDQHIDEPER